MIKKKRSQVSNELRQRITLALLEPGCDIDELGRIYNLSRSTLLKYRQRYRKQQLSNKNRSDFVEVKIEGVKEFYSLRKVTV